MRAAPSYCRAGHREGGRGSASGAAGRGRARALQLGVSARRPGRARGVRRANFYAETHTMKARRGSETGGGPESQGRRMTKGVARAPGARPAEGASGPPPGRPGGQPRAAAPRPPRLRSLGSKRMNQPRPGARPPRFLFSFSTPPAAGAAPLHRRGFPGTLPLTPLSAPSLTGSEWPERARGPRRALPRSLRPGRPAAWPWHHPEQPRAARFEAEPGGGGRGGERGRGRERLWGCGGSVRGERRKTRRGAPAARPPPGVAPAAGLRRDLARTRAAAHLPRGPPSAGEPPPLPGRPGCHRLVFSTTRSFPGGFAGQPDGLHEQGYLGPARPFLSVWALGLRSPGL